MKIKERKNVEEERKKRWKLGREIYTVYILDIFEKRMYVCVCVRCGVRGRGGGKKKKTVETEMEKEKWEGNALCVHCGQCVERDAGREGKRDLHSSSSSSFSNGA